MTLLETSNDIAREAENGLSWHSDQDVQTLQEKTKGDVTALVPLMAYSGYLYATSEGWQLQHSIPKDEDVLREKFLQTACNRFVPSDIFGVSFLALGVPPLSISLEELSECLLERQEPTTTETSQAVSALRCLGRRIYEELAAHTYNRQRLEAVVESALDEARSEVSDVADAVPPVGSSEVVDVFVDRVVHPLGLS